jgi:cyclic beta-1,2-glucan synthetase
MVISELRRLVPLAPPALCNMLGASSGELEAPIRSELFGMQRFAQHGASLGLTHLETSSRKPKKSFFPRLHNNIEHLRSAFEYISVQANAGYDISPAAEWLLENFHLIEVQFKEISEGLPLSYFRKLPTLIHPPLSGLPRVYAIAWAFVAHTDGAFDEELLIHFLHAYQERCELNLSELWALPTTLRVVLMENLRRLAERVAANKAARELANLCCDHLENYDLDSLDELRHVLQKRGVDRTFLSQMTQRLHESHVATRAMYQDWVQGLLPDFALLQTQQRADQAADNLSVSNAVTALRAIGDADWGDIVNRSSSLMKILLASDVFAAEHTLTRDSSLHAIELLARRSKRSEHEVACAVMHRIAKRSLLTPEQAVPSYWLLGEGRAELNLSLGRVRTSHRRWRLRLPNNLVSLYLGTVFTLTLGLVSWIVGASDALSWEQTLLLCALLPFPASEAVLAMINRLVSESSRPYHLHRLAFTDGIPAEHKVLVVIPCMLGDTASIAAQAHRLRLHYLANLENHAQFALLSDWQDAPEYEAPSDAALLQAAREQIETLNRLHPASAGDSASTAPRFILLHRSRSFSESEQAWIGWERKRGKLELLVKAIATRNQDAFLDLGSASVLDMDALYVVTLDSDTQLPPGRLRDLVGVAAHPYNQPRFDVGQGRVTSGYGILQPCVVTPLPAIHSLTRYHWLFAGQFGMDPYSAASSETYQDLFGEGTFMGKGLLNVAAMHAALTHRLPSDQILSHDLLEGALARCAAVTDITLLEDAPSHADVAASRMHRWTRGDWQLLPLLLDAKSNGISLLNAWKIADNLRRSLVAPASLALLTVSMVWQSAPVLLVLAVVMAAYTGGALIGACAGFVPSRASLERRHFLEVATAELIRALGGGLWHLALLLQSALLSMDAIARSLYRLTVSRRHLLQWTTAASAQSSARSGLQSLIIQHWSAPLSALALGGVLLVWGHSPLVSLLLCTVWAFAPVWIWFVSRVIQGPVGQSLSTFERAHLRGLARDTWRFFEHTVSAADHHLPPDNLQVAPHDMLAHRTSPTNIGFYMLAVTCAREFGWIATEDLLERLENTHQTLQGLQRDHGHFLNWYDTQSCAPLMPAYVSTVDSGNLSAHLLAVAQACRVLANSPDDTQALKCALADSQVRLSTLLPHRSRLDAPAREELRWLLRDHRATQQAMALSQSRMASADVAASVQRLLILAARLEELAWQPDFSFLYHKKRHLLHIGYRPAEQQLDPGFYDLLASEARLTSLIAIAKGDVPVAHWSALGRMFCVLQGQAGLRSWSGSMFEYLMPGLLISEPQGSVLADASTMAVREQMAFTHALQVPWGMSESAYAERDQTLAYQYAPQGVPRLALRRTPKAELVIAPYACVLAAQIVPQAAFGNLCRLEKLGARGHFGFSEALDYSPARQTSAGGFIEVETFMAHHQGMSLAALTNVLRGNVVQSWGMANPHLEAIHSLLHECTPREISRLYTLPAGLSPQMLRKRHPGLLRRVRPGEAALEPTHVLSNGKYSVALRANGAGWSRWGNLGVSRWRDDLLRDNYGHFFYVQRQSTGRALQSPVSLTQHPAGDPVADYQSTFHADRVCFHTNWEDLGIDTTVWVSPEDDIEFRQVELRNRTSAEIELEVFSAFELTLTDFAADEAHPAFSGMFVSAAWQANHQALVFERKARIATDSSVRAAHFLANFNHEVLGIRVCVDRAQWLGRNRDASHPIAALEMVGMTGESQELHTGLDPACVIAVRLRIPAQGSATLTFATAVAASSETLHAVVDKYRQPGHVQRASLMSATLAAIRLRALRISAEQFAALQSLCTAILWSVTRPSGDDPALQQLTPPVCDRRLLWRFGISGERPILLVSVGVVQGAGLLRSLAQALRMWAWSGMSCDLVVLNFEPHSYAMALQREIATIVERLASDAVTSSTPTALHLLRTPELSADELSTLRLLACLHLHADGRPLVHHLNEWIALHEATRKARQKIKRAVMPGFQGLMASTLPTGQFDAATGAFSFPVSHAVRPPRPWSNVLANAGFGSVLTETGGGFSWATNSRLHQITAWSNDPVSDPSGESFFLQDLRTDQTWSLTPNAHAAPDAVYTVTHGQGYTTIAHERDGLAIQLTWSLEPDLPVKRIHVAVKNLSDRTCRLRLLGLVEWVMGASRTDRGTCETFQQFTPGKSRLTQTLLCTQHAQDDGFGGSTAFFALTASAPELTAPIDWTCDRREFFNERGQLALPDQFDHRRGNRLDPCAALSLRFRLSAGSEGVFDFALGHAPTFIASNDMSIAISGNLAHKTAARLSPAWDELLTRCTVRTPDPLLDTMVNHWLLYQTLSCRIWAKAGFYQAGGATGFRDQLQDAMALAWAAPQVLRQQIELCASRQFVEGDVQHWWHQPTGAGVRTHFSDDLLWLPHALTHYLQTTADASLLDQTIPFLDGPSLAPGQEDAYFTPTQSAEQASVWEHAARTLDASMRRGQHGLPLMGSGDWNDGMNTVGREGRGESVWLGFFLCHIIQRMAPIARQRNELERAMQWETSAALCAQALQSTGWDGQWFRRAFFDNGQALGTEAGTECKIDLIAQAWAVLSAVVPLHMQTQAMDAADALLTDHDAGLLKLLAPPLHSAQPNAGYIQSYPPGVRENGGQYAHASVWALMAQARLHRLGETHAADGTPRCDLAYRYFTFLSAAHRSADSVRKSSYGLEPYAMAGDVYGADPYLGRGGWSWYTGAAGLMHRAALESLFGLHLQAQVLLFEPCLPSHWDEAELTLKRDGRTMHFILKRVHPSAWQETARLREAELLAVGTQLPWTTLPASSRHLIPLPVLGS